MYDWHVLAYLLLYRVDATEQAARRRVLSQKVVARVQKLETCRAWNSWLEVVGKRYNNVADAAHHHQYLHAIQRSSCVTNRHQICLPDCLAWDPHSYKNMMLSIKPHITGLLQSVGWQTYVVTV